MFRNYFFKFSLGRFQTISVSNLVFLKALWKARILNFPPIFFLFCFSNFYLEEMDYSLKQLELLFIKKFSRMEIGNLNLKPTNHKSFQSFEGEKMMRYKNKNDLNWTDKKLNSKFLFKSKRKTSISQFLLLDYKVFILKFLDKVWISKRMLYFFSKFEENFLQIKGVFLF